MDANSRNLALVGNATLVAAMLAATPAVAQAQPVPGGTSAAQKRHVFVVPCSSGALSGAITTANGLGAATLRLAPRCAYSIATPATADTALPQITGDIALVGGPSTIIRRDAAAPTLFRVIDVAATGTLRARGIAIANGSSTTGGGIHNAGIAILEFVTLTGNTATPTDGGGLANDTGARAFVRRSLISNNTASGGAGIANSGTLTVVGTRITANSSPTGGGGGILTNLDARTTVIRSTIDHNFVGFGGSGILNLGTLAIDRTLIVGNRNSAAEAFSGGGIYNVIPPAGVTIRRSIIRDNSPNNCFPLNQIPGCVT